MAALGTLDRRIDRTKQIVQTSEETFLRQNVKHIRSDSFYEFSLRIGIFHLSR
jgi:hypothetical protein